LFHHGTCAARGDILCDPWTLHTWSPIDGVSGSEASFVGFDDMTQRMDIEEANDGKEMASKYVDVERV